MNGPQIRVSVVRRVEELLGRAATVANGVSPEAGSPYRPSGVYVKLR